MKQLFNIKRFRFYLWVGLAYFLVGLLTGLATENGTFSGKALNGLWEAVYVTVVNYFFFEYTWPRLSVNRILRSVFLIFVQIWLYSVMAYGWRQLGITWEIYTPYVTYSNAGKGIGDQMGNSIGSLIFFGLVRHIYNYRKLKLSAQQLRIEKQEAELNYLKSQTNPHFLFNTLNNIYALTRDKSDLAPESILRLSKILRFMLYEAGGQYIAVEQELKIMSDYIALEQLRYDESLHVNFNYDVEDMKQALPPLLLIPLVENAFKHGVSETRHRPFVDIHLSINRRQLHFEVKNSSDGLPEERVKENIGLSNLRRQLQLLYTDYSLAVQQGESVFTATLKINLASHVQNKMHNHRG